MASSLAFIGDRARFAPTATSLSTLIASDGDVVSLAGRSAAADGGGIKLVYRATGRSGITVNNGTFFAGRLSDDYYEAIDKKTVTAQQFGAVADGSTDDYTAIQAAMNWATAQKSRLFLYGKLRFNTKLVLAGSQFEILMPNTMALGETGDYLLWGGANDSTAVELNVIQRAKMTLNVLGTTEQSGVTAIKWKNPDDSGTACNLNELWFNMSTVDLGLHLGDFDGDAYDSNIDDNRFRLLDFYRCKHLLLIDSLATDNNVVDHFHGGGVPNIATRTRGYLIRANRCGNGFRVKDGFARTDKLQADVAAIDIQSGGFSCDKFSLEGDGTENDIRTLDLGNFLPRQISNIQGLYSTSGFRDSSGDVCTVDTRGGVLFTGCVFSGNVTYSRPIASFGHLFTEGYGFVANGTNARIANAGGLGTRTGDGVDITKFEAVYRGIGVASDPYDNTATATFFVPVNRSSVFHKTNITANTSVGAPTAYYAPRDEGREITMIFRSSNAVNLLFNAAWILTNGTSTKAILANTTYYMTFVCKGGVWSETNSTPNDYSDLTNVPSLVSFGDFADAIGIDPAAWQGELNLGNASFENVSAFATAAQGTLADSAVQPASTDTLTNKDIRDFSNRVSADEIHIQCLNNSGVFIGQGKPVYITGYNFIGTAAPTIALADASSSATMPCIGITSETMGNGSFGEVVISGFIIGGINLAAFSDGDELYVSEVAGELTATPPVPDGTNVRQAVATVLYANASGRLQVLDHGAEIYATESLKGQVQLATTAEAVTGTDTVKAITAAGLQAGLDAQTHTLSDISDAGTAAASDTTAFVAQATPSAYIASPTVEQIRDILIAFGMMDAS